MHMHMHTRMHMLMYMRAHTFSLTKIQTLYMRIMPLDHSIIYLCTMLHDFIHDIIYLCTILHHFMLPAHPTQSRQGT